MRWRISLGRFLIRLGRCIKSLAIMAMRPDDLVEFSRQFYLRPNQLSYWSSEDFLDQGLTSLERALLEKTPLRQGRLLLLGVGGGRDAIALANQGFEVTGVDFVPEMVQRAQENAARRGLQLAGMVQEISSLNLPPESYDLAWIAREMYSCLPTRERRIAMLRRVHRALRPGGYFVCTFHWQHPGRFSPRVEWARRLFALLTLGNRGYEPGDILWLDAEFIHAFFQEADLRGEFAAGGFEVRHLHLPASDVAGAAVLQAKN